MFRIPLIMLFTRLMLLKLLQLISMMQFGVYDQIDGHYDQQYGLAVDAFRQNFKDGFEREGAHLAVIHNGKMVVNVWSGYSDSESGRKWRENTKIMFFSTTKAMASLCIALQVDKGRLSYDDLVVKYWPEYGQHGKQSTTIEDVLTHKAGIPYLENVTLKDIANQESIVEKLQQAIPLWPPGETSGYHAITFGWLVDEIHRRVDPDGRDVKQFLAQELASKYGLDLGIGIAKKDYHNLARLTQPGLLDYFRDILLDLRTIFMIIFLQLQPPNWISHRIRQNAPWMPMEFDIVSMNDPEISALNLASVTGVGNAHHLAKLFSLMINGTLLSNQTLELMRRPTLSDWRREEVVLYPLMKGRGFLFEKHPVLKGKYLFGHPGYGCQSLDIDLDNQLVIVYLTNGLKTGSGPVCQTYQQILQAIYTSIK